MGLSRSPRRGQSLALFALTLMLLTLLVTMTLGIGMRIKEKMELQAVTDAAAYSNSVVTARTLNGVAILNRAEVSVMVTLAATQSLISWTSIYMASLNAIQTGAANKYDASCDPVVPPGCGTACARLGQVAAAAASEYGQIYQQHYENKGQTDGQAGDEAETIQGAASAIVDLQDQLYKSMLTRFINEQKLTRKIVDRAQQGQRWDTELVVNAAAASVSQREVKIDDNSLFNTTSGGVAPFFALNPRNVTRELGVKAAMGSRGNPFVRDRAHGGPIATQLKQQLFVYGADVESLTVANGGMGYWALDGSSHVAPGPAPFAASADDHGAVTVTVGDALCMMTFTSATSAFLEGDDRTISTQDTHVWTGGADGDNGDQMDHPHTQGSCTNCPGVWTMFIDLNPEMLGDREAHLDGEPKAMAVVTRNLRARCPDAMYSGPCAGVDPWNFLFRFRFTNTGETHDARGLQAAGQDIAEPIAVATGLTYYHRPGHWREPPNFFNPFWRATLVSSAVDSQGDPIRNGQDLQTVINQSGSSTAPAAVEVMDKLKAAGFKGWQ